MIGRAEISRAGLDFIKKFEGFTPVARQLPDGRWLIGYGHLRTAAEGSRVTPEEAEDLLRQDLSLVCDTLAATCRRDLVQAQTDALISFIFHISPGQFRDSEVLRRLNSGDDAGAAIAMISWRGARVDGRVSGSDAIARRRIAEAAAFLSASGYGEGDASRALIVEALGGRGQTSIEERMPPPISRLSELGQVDVAASVAKAVREAAGEDRRGPAPLAAVIDENEIASRLERILGRTNRPYGRAFEPEKRPDASAPAPGAGRLIIDDLAPPHIVPQAGRKPHEMLMLAQPLGIMAIASLASLGVAMLGSVSFLALPEGAASVLLALSGALGTASAYFLATRANAGEN
jgi:GH24 family phage-related lysozyme (muramidase)